MRKSLHFIFLALLLFLRAVPSQAQFKSVYHLDISDGLSQNTINTIYQDERHYLWIGTRNGLNLYNGKDFTHFKHDKDDPSSLSTNDIKLISGDKKGQLFILTGYSQILRSDLMTNQYEVLVPSRVTTMFYSDPDLYYACSHELYRWEEGKDAPELIYTFENNENVVSALCAADGRLYIGTTSKGLYVLEPNGSLRHIAREGYVTSILVDSFQEVWITFQDKYGVLHLTADGQENFRYAPEDPNSLNSNKAQSCCEDKEGNVWIGTFEGLARYDRQTGEISRYENPVLGNRSIITLMTDHQGTVWAGTYYLGIYHFNPSDQVYDMFTVSSEGYTGLSSDIVGEMAEGEDGRIWIATEGGGVNSYDPKAGRFQCFNGKSAENVKALYLDQDILWAGTHLGGLERHDLNTGRMRIYRHIPGNASSLPSDIVRDIIPYRDELLLAVKGGIVVFNKDSGACRRFFEDDNYHNLTHYCSQLMLDHNGHLWLVHATNGIYRYDLETGEMTIFQSYANEEGHISPGRINHILEDSRGRIWCCNNQNGLDRYDPATDSFENFDVRKNQLSSNTIYAIAEITPDHFLISTDLGHSFFTSGEGQGIENPDNRKFPALVANERSLLVASDGKIYIGGVNGLVAFRKEDSSRFKGEFEVRPFRLFFDDRQIRPSEDGEVLTEDLSKVRNIVVGPFVSSISVEYACTDYRPYDKQEFLYRLEGFSDQWHRMDESHFVTFMNLRPGKYRLVVKPEEGESPACSRSELEIVVRPPFYRTTFAYIVYFLLAFAGIGYFAHLHNNRIRLKEAVKYEQYKLRFFTNISHEFRTPLSVIIAQIEMMMDAYHDDLSIYTPMRRVYRCCVQLKYLVSELLDFRKQEQGYMKLKVQQADVADFVHEQFLNFQVYARKKEIAYRFVKPDRKIEAWFDPKQMQKVINNLIFNAFRHVKPDGNVTVVVRTDGQQVFVDVSNTGKGIRPEDIDKIFNRFYQIDTKNSVGAGTGIGLALSKGIVELHHGHIGVSSVLDGETVFTVALPIGKEHFSADEIVSDETVLQVTPEASDEWYTAGLELASDGEEREEEHQDFHDCTVLLVDDNAALRETLRQLFSPYYNVCLAESGEEALEILRTRTVDLIVSDVMMPGMDGLEFCRRVKMDEKTGALPVVLLTACTDDTQKMAGLKYGADDYIIKPFSSREMIGRCNNLVNSRQLLKEKYSVPASGQRTETGKEPVLATNMQDLDFIRRAKEVVSAHLPDTDFRLENLAKELGVSRTKLFTRLKDIQGMTPMEFIMDIRLKEAARMLKTEHQLNISEISERTGFSSPKFLRKCFKEKYGKTPLEFRKS